MYNQLIRPSGLNGVAEVVAYMGAVQAQDYSHSRWAVGLRQSKATVTQVEQALDSGAIIRTHVLRPTWHLIAAQDSRWMLELSAPQIKRQVDSMARQHGLDNSFYDRAYTFLERVLSGQRALTRPALLEALNQLGLTLNSSRANLLLYRAEIDALICSGPREGNKNTFAWMDDRVPVAGSFDRQTALAALGQRYFTSHAPATLKDFQWWSGLNKADAQRGLEAARPQLVQTLVSGKEYWFSGASGNAKSDHPTVSLLPGFDEYIISYTDRDAIIPPELQPELITKNGIFKPALLQEGQVIGRWNRKTQKNTLQLEFFPFQSLTSQQEQAARAAARDYVRFHEMELDLLPF